MRNIIPLATLSALMITTSAQAEDWSGLYAGVHAGYGWTNNDSSLAGSNDEGREIIEVLRDFGIANAFSSDAGSVLGGAQIGFNFQSGALVWGVEADISRLDSSASNSDIITEDGDFLTNTAGTKLDWLGTVRIRAGTPIGQSTLLYVTGGLAYARIESSWSTVEDEEGEASDTIFSANDESWQVGWTIGGGAEFKIAEGISLRGEYLYYDLGDTSTTVTVHRDIDEPVGLRLKSDNNGHAIRAALNFEIGQ